MRHFYAAVHSFQRHGAGVRNLGTFGRRRFNQVRGRVVVFTHKVPFIGSWFKTRRTTADAPGDSNPGRRPAGCCRDSIMLFYIHDVANTTLGRPVVKAVVAPEARGHLVRPAVAQTSSLLYRGFPICAPDPGAQLVAQTVCLLYRRLAVGRPSAKPKSFGIGEPCRLETCATTA